MSLAGVDVPNDKRVVISLTMCTVSDFQHLKKILAAAGISRRCACSRSCDPGDTSVVKWMQLKLKVIFVVKVNRVSNV